MTPKYAWHVSDQTYPCCVHPSSRPKFWSVSFILRSTIFICGPNQGKVHWMTPKGLRHARGQKYPCAYCKTIGAQSFVHSAVWRAVFELRSKFEKSAPNDPKMTLARSTSKSTNVHATPHPHPRSPLFVCFILKPVNRFRVKGQFCKKCTKWPEMTFTCFRSKIPFYIWHNHGSPKCCLVCPKMSHFQGVLYIWISHLAQSEPNFGQTQVSSFQIKHVYGDNHQDSVTKVWLQKGNICRKSKIIMLYKLCYQISLGRIGWSKQQIKFVLTQK